jgi:hypothetical protein
MDATISEMYAARERKNQRKHGKDQIEQAASISRRECRRGMKFYPGCGVGTQTLEYDGEL